MYASLDTWAKFCTATHFFIDFKFVELCIIRFWPGKLKYHAKNNYSWVELQLLKASGYLVLKLCGQGTDRPSSPYTFENLRIWVPLDDKMAKPLRMETWHSRTYTDFFESTSAAVTKKVRNKIFRILLWKKSFFGREIWRSPTNIKASPLSLPCSLLIVMEVAVLMVPVIPPVFFVTQA